MSDPIEWPGEAFTCACFAECLHLTTYDDGEVGLSIWSHGVGHRPPWLKRLRHIWHIVRHGDPYDDGVVLDAEDAQRLGRRLLGALPASGRYTIAPTNGAAATWTSSYSTGGSN